jgi:hypothetical protein
MNIHCLRSQQSMFKTSFSTNPRHIIASHFNIRTTQPRPHYIKKAQQLFSVVTMIYLILILIFIVTANALSMANTAQTAQTQPKLPTWLHTATVWLIFYDVVTVGLFFWLWACRYLVRRKRGEGAAEMGARSGRRGRHTMIEEEMRMLGMW